MRNKARYFGMLKCAAHLQGILLSVECQYFAGMTAEIVLKHTIKCNTDNAHVSRNQTTSECWNEYVI